MRILLIHPECHRGQVGFRLAALMEPLALECLAATVPDHEVAILDMRLESDLVGALEQFVPDVAAVTALTTEVHPAQDVLRTVKAHAKEIFTVVGGHHATLIPEDFYLPCVDAICLGEGEPVFPKLIEALAVGRAPKGIPNVIWRDGDGQFVHNGRTILKLDSALTNLDATAQPRRDLVEKYRPEYFFQFQQPDSCMATGRGCPFRCNFCSVWEFYGGRTCQMSPQRVIEEIQTIDTRHITFVDDNFLRSYRRDLDIAERLKAEGIEHRFSIQCRTDSIARHPELVKKWVDVGLYLALLGLEGASDRMLQNVNKKNTARVNDQAIQILHDHGVIIWGAFIVDPDWTADDFKRLHDYVREKQVTHTQFTVLTPLPGTQLYREKYHELLTHDYTCYDTLHSVLPTRLPREEFYRHFANLYSQPSLGPLYDLISQGKISLEQGRRGNEILKRMSHWEFYLENDPVLGRPR